MRFLEMLKNQKPRGVRHRRQLSRPVAACDVLEQRLLLTAINISDEEQLFVELINRARANPTAEATRYGVALNTGVPVANTISTTPKQPLAVNQILSTIAVAHTNDMLNRNFFAHVNPDGKGVDVRADDAFYNWTLIAENLAYQGYTGALNTASQVLKMHESLYKSPGHRVNVFQTDVEEIGIGVRSGSFVPANGNASLVTENFGARGLNPFITGVVFTDANSSSFYDVGEAIRSGTVTATNTVSGATFSDAIGTSGNYGLIVPAGTYSVTAQFTVSGVAKMLSTTVTVGTDNVKTDFDATQAITGALTVTSTVVSINETGVLSTTSFTVTRNGTTAIPLTVSLTSSDTTEVTVPATVTIPAGQTSATFIVTAFNDAIIDGQQTARISATAAGFTTGTQSINVIDYSFPALPTTDQVATVVRPTFTWTGVSNAATYEIYVNNVTTGQTAVISRTGIATTSFTSPIDLGIGDYRVWVRGFTAGGQASLWSFPSIWKVRPTTTVLNSGRTETTGSFNIAWAPTPGASTYDVWVDRLTSRTSQYLRNTSVIGTSLAVSNFAIGSYGVWVRARNSRGDLTGWSPQATINVNLPVTGLSVSAPSLLATATLNWTAVGGATQYDVWIDNKTTGAAQFVRNQAVIGNSLSLPTLTPGSYRAWVRARDVGGAPYAWSTAFNFQFQAAPQLVTPTSTPQTPRPVFTWTPASGATRYELVIADVALNPISTFTDITGTTFTPSTDLSTGIYRAWIKAIDGSSNQSASSSVIPFTVASNLPDEFQPSDSELELAFASIDSVLTQDLTPSHRRPANNQRSKPRQGTPADDRSITIDAGSIRKQDSLRFRVASVRTQSICRITHRRFQPMLVPSTN